MNYYQLNIYEQICKKTYFTHNINYYQWNIYEQMYKNLISIS